MSQKVKNLGTENKEVVLFDDVSDMAVIVERLEKQYVNSYVDTKVPKGHNYKKDLPVMYSKPVVVPMQLKPQYYDVSIGTLLELEVPRPEPYYSGDMVLNDSYDVMDTFKKVTQLSELNAQSKKVIQELQNQAEIVNDVEDVEPENE